MCEVQAFNEMQSNRIDTGTQFASDSLRAIESHLASYIVDEAPPIRKKVLKFRNKCLKMKYNNVVLSKIICYE
jgi:hypothetical protein